MTENIETKNEVTRLRIFAAIVFVILISGAIIIGKCNKDHPNERFNKLHFLTR